MYSSIDQLKEACQRCTKCSLHKTRRNVVVGNDTRKTVIFLLGEAPGGMEDETGQPFAGEAGKKLDEFLEKLEMQREQVYIGNTVKCRPTRESKRPRYGLYANRKPKAGEIKACGEWLEVEIGLIKPKIIVTLGCVPLERVIGKKVKMEEVHGAVFFSDKYKCHVFSLYHPASVIYDRKKIDDYYKDLLKLKDFLKNLNLD